MAGRRTGDRNGRARSGSLSSSMPGTPFRRGRRSGSAAGSQPADAAVIAEEFRRRGAPGSGQDVHNLWANTLLTYGTPALQQRLDPPAAPRRRRDVPPLLRAGRRLGSRRAPDPSRARRRRVRRSPVRRCGRRRRTTAEYGMLVARTDWDVPKHRGISFFFLPMRQTGVEIRGIKQITGETHFNEVFIDGARAPADHLLGDLNDGWRVLQTALAYERSVMGDVARGPRTPGSGRRRRGRPVAARPGGRRATGRRRSGRRSPASTRCARSTGGTTSARRRSCSRAPRLRSCRSASSRCRASCTTARTCSR